ncbi:hypothetical protein PMAYCL1PPCAC_11744, partial [Pristionchus mayeri]
LSDRRITRPWANSAISASFFFIITSRSASFGCFSLTAAHPRRAFLARYPPWMTEMMSSALGRLPVSLSSTRYSSLNLFVARGMVSMAVFSFAA